jgi:hypothetical protein
MTMLYQLSLPKILAGIRMTTPCRTSLVRFAAEIDNPVTDCVELDPSPLCCRADGAAGPGPDICVEDETQRKFFNDFSRAGVRAHTRGSFGACGLVPAAPRVNEPNTE